MPTISPSVVLTEHPQPPKWVVERFIPQDTVIVLAGLEGTGKSVFSYATALAVATGQPILGLPTTQLRVLYFDSENSRPDFGGYLRQLWLGMGAPNPKHIDEFLRIEHFSLTIDWQHRFASICAEWKPGLIIVDTANSCFSIVDENSNAEAAKIVSLVNQARPAESSVILMKHEREKKEGRDRSVRGAKYWLGAVDQVVYFSKAGGNPLPPYNLWRTKLTPAKKREYGLEHEIKITPNLEMGPLGKVLKLAHS